MKLVGRSINPTKLTATITSPPVAKARAPNRSEYHPEIGPAWNSCAGMTEVDRVGDNWAATAEGYDVKLIHYWSQFKPWAIDCPIYASYEWVDGGTKSE